VAVGRYRLGRVLEAVLPDFAQQAQWELMQLAFGEAVTALEAAHAIQPIDAVVAAGASGAYLRAHLDLPVALVDVNSLDLLQALSQARALSPRIALLLGKEVSAEFAHFSELFGLQVLQQSYRDEASATACVQALQAQGIEVVVAPGLVADLAEQQGLRSVFLYSEEAIRKALQHGVEMARRAHRQRARTERLNTILAQLQDGVVAVDPQERIEALNPAMARLLGADLASLRGRPLSEVAPSLNMRPALASAAPMGEEVVLVGGRTVVLRRTPILELGEVTGGLAVCRDPEVIERADRRLRATRHDRGGRTRYQLADWVGTSPAAEQVRQLAKLCAGSEATVLLCGESGTGKELVAQAIHHGGPRASQPFLAVNCAALGESLLESELFGYEEGAFTGARRGGKPGLVEAAHTGTLFLDEIGDMPLALQTRLLRVLQEREVLRIGATQVTPVDVRVIAATHADLPALVARGAFRRDLFYRLAVLRIDLPALHERRGDLPPLVDAALQRLAPTSSAAQQALLQRAAQILVHEAHGYGWPGNVRELHNWLERLQACQALWAPHGVCQPAQVKALFAIELALDVKAGAAPEPLPPQPTPQTLRGHQQQTEWQQIHDALQASHGRQAEACARLGISRSTLWRRLRDMAQAGWAPS
jgi:propionate catabolism operon transcriptional regulator